MRLIVVSLIVAGCGGFAAQDPVPAPSTFNPRLAESRLLVGSQVLTPLRVLARAEHHIGKHVFDLDKTPDGQRIWSVCGDADRAHVLT